MAKELLLLPALLLQAEDVTLDITAKLSCVAVENSPTFADMSVNAGPRKDIVWICLLRGNFRPKRIVFVGRYIYIYI